MIQRRSAQPTALDAQVTALAMAAGRGDRPALGEFIRLTQPDVWRFIASLAGRDDADDLTQDTYLRAMDALPGFEGRSSARTWLLTIARRVCADRVRYEMARPQTPRTHEWWAQRDEVHADRTVLVEASLVLDSLGRDRREAFVLTQLLGFSYQQAAEVCGCKVGTVRSRVARARAELVAACGEGVRGGAERVADAV